MNFINAALAVMVPSVVVLALVADAAAMLGWVSKFWQQ
jgi:hypothetical protein